MYVAHVRGTPRFATHCSRGSHAALPSGMGSVAKIAFSRMVAARSKSRLVAGHPGGTAASLDLTSTTNGSDDLKLDRETVEKYRSLIEETDLSITKIGFYSGFRRIRQFNHAIRAAFDRSPSELRRSYKTPKTRQYRDGSTLFVSYVPEPRG